MNILKSKQVEVMLGVHRNTLLRIPAKDLPYFTVGGMAHRRYKKSDVDAYITKRSHGEKLC